MSISSKWTNLPRDILINLLKYIDLTIDIPRIRGVCPSWRSALPLNEIPKLPSRLPAPPIDVESGLSALIVQSRFYLISPLDGSGPSWLTRMCQTGPIKWHLINPFDVEEYFVSDPPVTGEISLLDCSVTEIAKPLSLLCKSDNKMKTASKKVVGGWNFEADYIFAVLAQLEVPGRGCGCEGGLVFKRLDGQEWVRIEGTFDDDEDGDHYRILDIAYHDGKFYAFELVKWKVGVIDPEKDSISLEFMAAPGVLDEPIDYMVSHVSVSIDGVSYILNDVYLVPSNEELYLVICLKKLDSKKLIMFVFILKEGKWERVTSLGDQILFIGYDASFGISSSSRNLANWKPGSICLFTRPFPLIYDACSSAFQGLPEGEDCLNMISFPEYWRYLNMYNMEEEEKGIVAFEELSMKEYTELFFPPPAWVKWRCPRFDNVEVMMHDVKYSAYSSDYGNFTDLK